MNASIPSFGSIGSPRPGPLPRDRFRIAVFGDFTGRSGKGVVKTGSDIAGRRAVRLDIDTLDDVIESFATTLSLPIGKNGAGIEVRLNKLDDLHPDQLFENVEIFQALSGLKQRLDIGSMSDKMVADLLDWSERFGTKIRLPKIAVASAVPADRSLSDFQALIGDTTAKPRAQSAIDNLIAQIVGPHILAAPDKSILAMQAAVDEALSAAMRLVLHHRDFQALEAQWRSLDLLARSIETDENLEIVLYDVSAEEFAADLAAGDILDESGVFELLNGAVETGVGSGVGVGGFSAMFGLYTFQETPPHAEILGRMAKIAAHVDAPFFTAISPDFLDVAIVNRHPLVSHAWDRLRLLPEANYLGLASPRFMLRRTYGRKSDPISAFKYEEFSNTEGLSGILWANPAVLVAILMAKSFTDDGWEMSLGSVMSLGDIPYQIVVDRYGDQIALPCTGRNLSSSKLGLFARRGIMPVLSIKGRDEVRLASFRAIGGKPVIGPWSGPKRQDALELARQEQEENNKLLQPVVEETPDEKETPASEPEPDKPHEPDDTDASLEDFLAGFVEENDEADDTGTDDEIMDAELAALLEGL